MSKKEIQILVTVGTFFFDDLIEQVDKPEFYEMAIKNGVTKLIIQKAMCKYEPVNYKQYQNKLDIQVAGVLTNFESYIKSSEIVISHGGAGCILESLKNKRKTIVCINQKLMDNHQIELATSLENDNYIVYCKDLNNLNNTVEEVLNGKIKLTEYPEFNYDIIPNEIYKLIDE